MYSVSDGESEDDIGPTETTAKGFVHLLLTSNVYYYTNCASYS